MYNFVGRRTVNFGVGLPYDPPPFPRAPLSQANVRPQQETYPKNPGDYFSYIFSAKLVSGSYPSVINRPDFCVFIKCEEQFNCVEVSAAYKPSPVLPSRGWVIPDAVCLTLDDGEYIDSPYGAVDQVSLPRKLAWCGDNGLLIAVKTDFPGIDPYGITPQFWSNPSKLAIEKIVGDPANSASLPGSILFRIYGAALFTRLILCHWQEYAQPHDTLGTLVEPNYNVRMWYDTRETVLRSI